MTTSICSKIPLFAVREKTMSINYVIVYLYEAPPTSPRGGYDKAAKTISVGVN